MERHLSFSMDEAMERTSSFLTPTALQRTHSKAGCCESSIPILGTLGDAPPDVPQNGHGQNGKRRSRKRFVTFTKVCKESLNVCDTIEYHLPRERFKGEDTVDGIPSYYGHVNWVIEGNTPAAVLNRALDASSFRYAFEAGTTAPIGDNTAIGEMIAFNGTAYVRSTGIGTDEYYKTIHHTHVRCAAALIIAPADAVADIVATTRFGGMTWTSAMNDVYAKLQQTSDAVAVAIGGIVTFEKFVGVAVARSMVENENIFEHKHKYYPFPPTESYNVRCVVFGVVGDVTAAAERGIEKMDTVLYAGASGAVGTGAQQRLGSHAHVVTLKPHCLAQTPQQVKPEDVAECYHLDASSVIGSFDLELFAIKDSLVQHPTVEKIDKAWDTRAPAPRCNCAEWICNALVDAGVTHIFGGHGGALVPLVNAVVRNPNLEWIVTRNEANASLMAAAYAKLTGRLGCCIATSGPGATNLTTGLYDAQLDQCSLIAITGLKPRGGIGYSEFQDFQQSRMFAAGGLPFSHDVSSEDAVVPLLRDAVAKALTLRTCVHLGIPVDVQAAECPVPAKKFCAADARSRVTFPSAQAHVLDQVAMELKLASQRGGSRVVITIGHRCAHAGQQILQLAKRIRAPILTRLDAKGCVNELHPLAFGCIGVHGKPGLERAAMLIETAQLVLSFGNHDDTLTLCNRAGLQVRPMIQFEPDAACVVANARYRALHEVVGDPVWAITCLLEKLDTLNDMEAPDSIPGAVHEWADDGAQNRMDLLSLPQQDARSMPRPPTACTPNQPLGSPDELWLKIQNGDWDRITASKRRDQIGRYAVVSEGDHMYCHPAAVMRTMSKFMGPEDVLCVDTGDVTLWAGLCAVLTKGSRTLSSERMGTMGYSLCAGIVACLVRKDAGRGVVVVGDGGAQMTINELGTVKQIFACSKIEHKMLIIILDNEVLGRVVFGFEGALGCELGPAPDFVKLARAYGGDGAKLTDPDDLTDAMAKAFTSTGLYVLHVLIDPSIKADMAIFHDTSITMMNSG